MSGVSVKKSWRTLSFLDEVTRYKPVSFTELGDTLAGVMYRWARPGQLCWLERPLGCSCWEVQKLRVGHMWLVLGKEMWTEVRDYGEIEWWGGENNRWGESHAGCPGEKNSREEPKAGGAQKTGGVRFGIVGVLERIKDSNNDKKVSCRKASFGNSEVVADLGLEF